MKKVKVDRKPAARVRSMHTVPVTVASDPRLLSGLRGMKAMIFAKFAEAGKSGALPDMDVLTEEVRKHFPQSRWLARPVAHYTYFKSKWKAHCAGRII